MRNLIQNLKHHLAQPEIRLLLFFAIIKFLIHFLTNLTGGYGYFRDELYYVACSERLDLGYVDQPPLSIFILAVNRLVLGDSIVALRFLPALVGAATVFVAGLIVRELGGGRTAIIVASLAGILSIIRIAMDSIYSMNTFDHLFWAIAVFAFVRLIRTEDPRYWYAMGLAIGLGLLNKVSLMWLGFGIVAALVFSPLRFWLKRPQPYIAAFLVLLLFLPYIIWNVTHDFAHLEFIRNATRGKYASQNPVTFLLGQFLTNNPALVVIWVAGLIGLFATTSLRPFRPLAIIFLGVTAILVANIHSKSEYLSPAFVILFATGGVVWEQLFTRPRWGRFRSAILIAVVIIGLVPVPITLPVLPIDTYIRYAALVGFGQYTSEGKKMAELPQFYADRFGWEQKAEDVARVFHKLTPEEQSKAMIFADNYGRCAAIDFFGRKYGLPKTIGRHNNYWIWGPRGSAGELVIVLGGNLEDKLEVFERVEIAGVSSCTYCMPYENNLRIYVCRNLKGDLQEFWLQIRHFD